MQSVDESSRGEPIEPQYKVRLDDTGHKEAVQESWLEPI